MYYWPWVSLTVGGWGSEMLLVGIWQLPGLWVCWAPWEGNAFGGSQTTLLLCCFTHWRISYRTSPTEIQEARIKTRAQNQSAYGLSEITLMSTWAGATPSEVLLGEQTQGSAIHFKASLLWPAQWVLLLSPVEPVSNIFLIPQRWVYS